MSARKNLSLTEMQRLYFDEEFTSLEIGEKLGCSPTNVQDCLKRAGSTLRKSGISLKPLPKKIGPESPFWKGGTYTNSEGRVLVMRPANYKNSKQHYVPRARVIWEEIHQKSLPPGWIVHHLNGIPNDDRPENLAAFFKSKHDIYIPTLKKRIRELEAEINLLKRTLESNQSIFYIGEN